MSDLDDLRARRVESLVVVLRKAGLTATYQAVTAALDAAFDDFHRSWRANEQFRAADGVDRIIAELGLVVDDALRSELTAAALDGMANIVLSPHVATTLRQLHDAGLRIGIICDVGWAPSVKLRSVLERHEVLGFFDHWSFSDEVGEYKPSPRMFAHAHAGLGVADPSRAAHVGDLRRTDVAGARACGALAIRYRGVFDDLSDGDDGHHVIDDHSALPALLGLA